MLLLPTRCAACWQPGPSPCARCVLTVRRTPPGLPPPPGVDILLAPFAYEGIARAVVTALKFRDERAGLPWLSRAMSTSIVWGAMTSVDMVTWAPTTPRRRRWRGHDHAEVLARSVASELDLPCHGLLVRRAGRPQTGQSRTARLDGPMYRSRGPAPSAVLLVDDVVTTGVRPVRPRWWR
jgi:predicted amidophosphoribosyltransferase